MSTEIAKKQTIPEIMEIGDLVFAKLPPLAQSWMVLAATKKTTFDSLQRHELDVQQKLNEIKMCDPAMIKTEPLEKSAALLKQIQSAISAAKSVYAEMKQQRLEFTGTITEKLIDSAMAFEKRADVLIADASKHEFEFRKSVEEKQNEGAAFEREKQQFIAHVKNEYFRIAAKYRADLLTMVTQSYTVALRQKITMDQLPGYLNEVRDVLGKIELDDFRIFTPVLLTRADLGKLFNEIPAYDGKSDFEFSLKSLDEKFELYESDLKNANAAIESQQKQLQQTLNNDAEQLEMETATNNLIAHASNTTMIGGATVKRKMAVVIENTDDWAISIVSAFMKNWAAAKTYLRVKTWEKLSLGQMAAALGSLATDNEKTNTTPGTVYPGLSLMVVEK